MDKNQILSLIIYTAITAIAVAIEHHYFGKRWKNNELARRTMGHATILLLALCFVPFGLVDLSSLIAITVATGAAGAVLGYLMANEQAQKRELKAKMYREAAGEYEQDTEHGAGALRERAGSD